MNFKPTKLTNLLQDFCPQIRSQQ